MITGLIVAGTVWVLAAVGATIADRQLRPARIQATRDRRAAWHARP